MNNLIIRNRPEYRSLKSFPIIHSKIMANIIEKEREFLIHLALPGFQKSQIALKVDGDKLIISGQNQNENEVNFIRKEYEFNGIEKSFLLPKNVDIQSIEAEMKDGILTITIAKVLPKPEINIEVK